MASDRLVTSRSPRLSTQSNWILMGEPSIASVSAASAKSDTTTRSRSTTDTRRGTPSILDVALDDLADVRQANAACTVSTSSSQDFSNFPNAFVLEGEEDVGHVVAGAFEAIAASTSPEALMR